MSGATSQVYNLIFKRTSTFALAAMATVFFFERTFDLSSQVLFEKINAGKLFKDIGKSVEE